MSKLSKNNTDGIGTFYPFRSTKNKRRQTCISPKVVKFDHFKIWVMDNFPRSKKFYCITISYPILNDISRPAVAFFCRSHVCKGYIILVFPVKNIYLCVLNRYFYHYNQCF